MICICLLSIRTLKVMFWILRQISIKEDGTDSGGSRLAYIGVTLGSCSFTIKGCIRALWFIIVVEGIFG